MSICRWTVFRLASLLCVTATKVVYLLTNSFLKGLLLVLPDAKEAPTNPSASDTKEDQSVCLYEYEGEMFSLEDIAGILAMDYEEIGRRIRAGESLKTIIETPT